MNSPGVRLPIAGEKRKKGNGENGISVLTWKSRRKRWSSSGEKGNVA